MMGNETSQLSGLKIEDKATEITDFWSHFQATISDSCRYFSLKDDGSVSVFKGEVVLGPLWTMATPLEKCSNNLLKYRHPCIVRYISSWQQRFTFHLVTEFVQPLSHVIIGQTPLQICIGLNNILRALVFLHEQAGVSHNNVGVSSIYVTGDGQWKLGGLQYLCNFTDLNPTYLKHARIHRYDKAIDPDEESHDITSKVDQYAFAVLVDEVFKEHDVPYLREFKTYCKDCLQNNNPSLRPDLSKILQHSFFNHEFISIYKFLNFLAIKKEDDKSQFFTNILKKLKCFDEETVAKQLSGLLLSRLTLLDSTARRDVIPYILKPKNERMQNGEHSGFFSLSVFKEHVKPRLLQLFGVRDSQVRMLLLMHFTKYVQVFSHEELSQHILPELLLGIKDVDDNLVASTLVCLSELVPILGADAVVGGKRSKFFTDGRPKLKMNVLMTTSNTPKDDMYSSTKSLRDFHCSEDVYDTSAALTFEKTIALNERPSPVGGESHDEDIGVERNANNLINSEIEWDDWDNTNHQVTLNSNETGCENNILVNSDFEVDNLMHNVEKMINIEKPLSDPAVLERAAQEAKKNILDISELDIKNQKIDYSKKNAADDIDFFADMIPVIEKQKIISIPEPNTIQDISSKLNFIPDEECDENEGWGENWS
ncbi:protein-associating with the carboxyl-terminal domain of ezrin isoform X2 [Battus philenor]|uniref:protein-associating with the carboxyl-terminal domain of ezrin isoform X2 n=1 Tax=Battus philenor TaxID=42288 RepID=UPI0035CF99E4